MDVPELNNPVWSDQSWLLALERHFKRSTRRTVVLTQDVPEVFLDEPARVVGDPSIAVAGIPCCRGTAALYAPVGYSIRLIAADKLDVTVAYDVPGQDDAEAERDLVEQLEQWRGRTTRAFENTERITVSLTQVDPCHTFGTTVRVHATSRISVAGIPGRDGVLMYAQVGQSVILLDPEAGPLDVVYDKPLVAAKDLTE